MRALTLFLPALLPPAAWCLGDDKPCVDDIGSMTSDGAQAVDSIRQAVADCKTAGQAACSVDIGKLLDGLDRQAYDVAQALGDCAHAGADCVGSLQSVGDCIGGFKPVAKKILTDCGDKTPSRECVADLFQFVAAGMQLEHAFSNVTDTCHMVQRAWSVSESLPLAVESLAKDLQATKFGAGRAGDTCRDDVTGVVKSGAELVRSMVDVSGECKKEGRAACAESVGTIVDGLESEQRLIAQAVGGCNLAGAECVHALTDLGASIGDFKPAAVHMTTDCGGTKVSAVKCIADAVLLATDAALLGASIAQAAQACHNASAPAIGANIVV